MWGVGIKDGVSALGVEIILISVMLRISALSLLASVASVVAGVRSPRQFADLQRSVVESRATNSGGLYERATAATISFSNPKTNDYFVDGTKIPEVDFDVGPSWSGEWEL